jgi:ribosomal protein L20A (L18A)
MRHTFLTDKYAETSKKQKALETDLSDMGSSNNVAKNYIKLD